MDRKENTIEEVRIILEKVRDMDYEHMPDYKALMPGMDPFKLIEEQEGRPHGLIEKLKDRKVVILELRKNLEDESVSFFCAEALWEFKDRNYLLNFVKKTKPDIQLKILRSISVFSIYFDEKVDEKLIIELKKTLDELYKTEDPIIKKRIEKIRSDITQHEYRRLKNKISEKDSTSPTPRPLATKPEKKGSVLKKLEQIKESKEIKKKTEKREDEKQEIIYKNKEDKSRKLQKKTEKREENKLKKYDVAFSFAGEDRDYVKKVAKELRNKDVKVFYDLNEEADLWGKDLYVHLSKIYKEESQYTVIFISKHYANKLWTNHERKSAQARAFEESEEYILPARFDNTEIPGILPTTGYIDLNKKTPEEFANLICQKLRINHSKHKTKDQKT